MVNVRACCDGEHICHPMTRQANRL
jgi:hypothetical protein